MHAVFFFVASHLISSISPRNKERRHRLLISNKGQFFSSETKHQKIKSFKNVLAKEKRFR
ncbi:MAG: hypothetical protein IH571_04145 [Acholeplasmataceae bacterium]|nr:hypothetical protein [Acholeplasmataceae bacterium]